MFLLKLSLCTLTCLHPPVTHPPSPMHTLTHTPFQQLSFLSLAGYLELHQKGRCKFSVSFTHEYKGNKTCLVSTSGGTTGGEGGRRGAYDPPSRTVDAMLCSLNLHDTASKPYVDQEMDIRTFYVTQDRENPTDSA